MKESGKLKYPSDKCLHDGEKYEEDIEEEERNSLLTG